MHIELKKILFTFNQQLVSIPNTMGSPNVRLFAFININSDFLRLSVNLLTNEWHFLHSQDGIYWCRVPEKTLNNFNYESTVFYQVFPNKRPSWNSKNSKISCMEWIQSLVDSVEVLVRKVNSERQIKQLKNFSSEVAH